MWSKEAPGSPGFYWYQYDEGFGITILEVKRDVTATTGFRDQYGGCISRWSGLWWSVPIPPPTEAADADNK